MAAQRDEFRPDDQGDPKDMYTGDAARRERLATAERLSTSMPNYTVTKAVLSPAADCRPVRGRRDPVQRHAGSDCDRRMARRRRPRRSAGGAKRADSLKRCSPPSGPVRPPAGPAEPDEIASVIAFLCSESGPLRDRRRLERGRRHRPDHHLEPWTVMHGSNRSQMRPSRLA